MLPVLFVLVPLALAAQDKLDADAPACADSRILPKLTLCRIDNCEKKESDHRDVPIREDEHGEAVISPLDGDSRSVMYECQEGTAPGDVIQQAAAALRAQGFDVPYRYVDKEASVTAHKGDLWITVEAASRFYTLVELKAFSELETASDAAAMAEALERYGHVPLYGVHFLTGSAGIAPESVLVLREVAAMLEDDPDLRVRIEGHTDNLGDKQANLALSAKRATAVQAYLAGRGIKRPRMEIKAMGDSQPVADNDSDAGRSKNRRIELVKLAAQ
jgi:hypothetical protein